MIAAGRVAEDAISKKIMDVTEIRRNTRNKETPLTPGQKAAWDKLVEEFGPDAKQLEWPSARECAEEAVKAMAAEAEKLSIGMFQPDTRHICNVWQEAGQSGR
jgi:hypothetical protein